MSSSAPAIPHDDSTAEMHRHGYNAAFEELGLAWQLDAVTYRALAAQDNREQRMRAWLQAQYPHLLKSYDADFLIRAIHEAKARHCLAVRVPAHA